VTAKAKEFAIVIDQRRWRGGGGFAEGCGKLEEAMLRERDFVLEIRGME
jgi:hypothetical protein